MNAWSMYLVGQPNGKGCFVGGWDENDERMHEGFFDESKNGDPACKKMPMPKGN